MTKHPSSLTTGRRCRPAALRPASFLLLLAGLLLLPPGGQAQVPSQINHEGLLLDEHGLPLSGTVTLSFGIYDRLRGEVAPLWSQQEELLLVDGYYQVLLGGEAHPFGDQLFADPPLFLGITLGDGTKLPRQPLSSVPYALQAQLAENATGDITPHSVKVGGKVVIDASGNIQAANVVGLAGVIGGVAYDTPQELLDALLTLEDPLALLDADLLDGHHADDFQLAGASLDQLMVDGVTVADTAAGTVRLGDLSNGGRSLDLFTGGSARLRITDQGRLGVGTTDPKALLQVAGNSVLGPNVANDVARLQLSENEGTHPFMTFHENNRVVNAIGNHLYDLGLAAANDIVFKTGYQWNQPLDQGGSERLRLTQAGRVGLGTASPTQKLHVAENGAGNIGITIQNTGSGQPQVRFLNSAGTERAALTYVPMDESFRFFLTGANRMWLRSDGNLGIGTTSPQQRLDVAGTARVEDLVPSADGGGDLGTADLSWGSLFARQVQLAPRTAPTCDEDAAGLVYYDATSKLFRGCNGTDWVELSGGGGDGGGSLGLSQDKPAVSCKAIKDGNAVAPSGTYWLKPLATTYQAYCNMTTASGGWTRVARMVTDPIAGYCQGDPAASFDLQTDPYRRAGKLRDTEVRAILGSAGAVKEIMFYQGVGGRGDLIRHVLSDVSHYNTSNRSGVAYCSNWTCADGSLDSTTCGGEGDGCPVVGKGTGGDAKKLYVDSSFAAHYGALHAGGSFCGLDNRVRYATDVYVR